MIQKMKKKSKLRAKSIVIRSTVYKWLEPTFFVRRFRKSRKHSNRPRVGRKGKMPRWYRRTEFKEAQLYLLNRTVMN